MVKITNKFGDVKKGKQHTAVYQDIYGNQMRRTLKDKKDEHTRGQLEQRARFKVGIDFATSLTKAQRDFIKSYMAEAGIRSPDGLPTTWYSFVKKIAMTRPKVEMEVEGGEEGFSGPYAAWNYRKPITLNNSGSELTNYQVLITLTPSNFTYAKCKNDGSDLRFSQDNKTTPIKYWIEDWNYNGTSKIWVKVDTIPTGESICLYLYYDNSEATSESNGDNTFEFFDDFPGSSINSEKWTGALAYGTVADGILTYVGDGNWRKIYSIAEFTPNMALRVKTKFQASDTAYIGFEKDPCCNGRSIIYDRGLLSTDDVGDSQQTGYLWNNGVWNLYDLKQISGTSVKLYVNGILKATHTTKVGTIAQPTFIGSQPTNNTIYTDWILKRKYAPPEPTVTELGSEEESTSGYTLNKFSIHHPAIKSYEILDNGPKEEGLSNLEDHISTVVTRSNLNLTATKIKVKTLANQEYEFIIK